MAKEIPETIVHEFDGVECECSVTKDENGEFVVEVIEDVENGNGDSLKGRFIKFPADHKF